MKVDKVNTSLPVVQKNYKPVLYTESRNSLTKISPIVVDELIGNLVDERESKNQKQGKGFYIVINDANFNSLTKKIKSTLTPIQEQINKVYHLSRKRDPGLLVDMTI